MTEVNILDMRLQELIVPILEAGGGCAKYVLHDDDGKPAMVIGVAVDPDAVAFEQVVEAFLNREGQETIGGEMTADQLIASNAQVLARPRPSAMEETP